MNNYFLLMIRKKYNCLYSGLILDIFLNLTIFMIAGFMVMNYDIANQDRDATKINKLLGILSIDKKITGLSAFNYVNGTLVNLIHNKHNYFYPSAVITIILIMMRSIIMIADIKSKEQEE